VAIAGHHDALSPSAVPLARALHAGEALAMLVDDAGSEELDNIDEAGRMAERAGVSDADREQLLGQIKREADALAVSFSMA
jgi:hypothetical protein